MARQVEGEDVSDWFWEMIGRAARDHRKLRQLLWELSEEEVARFHREFVLATSVLRGEPYDAILGESGQFEDGIMDIAYWVVAQGRTRYEDVLENPETIPRRVDDGGRLAIMHHVTVEVFDEKFGKELDFF